MADLGRRRRWLWLALGVLVVALLVLWSFEPWASVPLEGGSHAARRPADASSSELIAPARDGDRDAIEPAAPEARAPETTALSAPVQGPTPEGGEIEGVLLVQDELERAFTDLDGSFLLTGDDEHEGRTVEVHAGRWRVTVRSGMEYRVENLIAGGRPAVSELDRQPVRRADGSWVVLARWARPTLLVVRGSDTGLDLAQVDVAEVRSAQGCHPGEPTDEQWIVRDARSPIEIPLPADGAYWPGVRTLHVRAPGYAWGCIRVPETLGGEFALALEPGGTLEIAIAGQDERSGAAVLRLRRAEHADDDPLSEHALAGRSALRIDGLAAGRWIATVELGHRWRWPQVLARGEAELAAGGLARIELVLEPLAPVELAPLSGRVTAHRAWALREPRLTLELLDEPPRGSAVAWKSVPLGAPRTDDAGRSVWEWSIEGGVQPGRWSLDVLTVGVGLALDVPAQGLADVELAIPDPVEITVTTVDAASGLPVLDAKLGWMPPRTWSDVGGQVLDAEPLGEGRWIMSVPTGPIELWCFPERHGFVHQLIEAGLPDLEHTLSLEPAACGFRLRLRDGTTLVPWPISFGYGVKAQRIDGEGSGWLHEQDAHQTEARFVVGSPGRYRLELPAIPGYAPIPVQHVDVAAGEYVRLDVELLRR